MATMVGLRSASLTCDCMYRGLILPQYLPGSLKIWLDLNEPIVLVAYNGDTCDLKWLWCITQVSRSLLSLSSQIKYFLGSLQVTCNYKECKPRPSKSNLGSIELGWVWKLISNGHNLNGAHSSLVDAKALTDIILHPSFVLYIDCKSSIQPIDEILLNGA